MHMHNAYFARFCPLLFVFAFCVQQDDCQEVVSCFRSTVDQCEVFERREDCLSPQLEFQGLADASDSTMTMTMQNALSVSTFKQ